jgi:hypothetical protein
MALNWLAAAGSSVFATYRSGNIRVELGANTTSLFAPPVDELTLENYRNAA